MRRIAVINQKGGVGKTTTTVNLGAALACLGQRVLLCDLDPQCNLTVHVGQDPATVTPSLYDLFHGKATLGEVARPTALPGLSVAPASIDLAGIELELVNTVGREVLLRDAFEQVGEDAYDTILVDCPPSLGLLSLNALVASEELIVPIQAEFFALQGLGKLLEIVDLVCKRLNPGLRIGAMVSCRHDPSTNLSKAVVADIKNHFADVFLETVIRRNIKLAEAPSHGRTIFEYDPASRGAEDYLALAWELLGHKDGAPSVAAVLGSRGDVEGPGGSSPEEAAAPAPDPAPAPAPPPAAAPDAREVGPVDGAPDVPRPGEVHAPEPAASGPVDPEPEPEPEPEPDAREEPRPVSPAPPPRRESREASVDLDDDYISPWMR